jgi:2-dehydro-3-deoxyphosphooctonate aldolase (KDO 8-P synthase)
VAVGVAGVFIETHDDPDRAPSDGPTMMPLKGHAGADRRTMALDSCQDTPDNGTLSMTRR